jgi:hypothetical protein
MNLHKTALCQPYNNAHEECPGEIYMGGECECPCHWPIDEQTGMAKRP